MSESRPKFPARQYPLAVIRVLNCFRGDVVGAPEMPSPNWAVTREVAIWMAVRSGHGVKVVASAFRLGPDAVSVAVARVEERRGDEVAWREAMAAGRRVLGKLESLGGAR